MKINMPLKLWAFSLLIFIIVISHFSASFASKAGSLYVASKPSSAVVYLDNTEIGKTDIIISDIPAGIHTVTFELSGYQTVKKSVTVTSGSTTRVDVDLQAIIAPAPAEPPRTLETRKKIQEPFIKFLNPWIVLLIILVFAAFMILAVIVKSISRGKRLFPRGKPKRVPKRTAKVKAPPRLLEIPTSGKGISLKKAPVFGNYRVLGKIASGGMATIYKAIHIRKGWEAVLKIPYEQFQNDRNFIERFRREAELGKRLHNENIIRIYESGTSKDGLTYIAMEYVQGIDLRQYLDKYGRMPINEALKIVVHVCRALDYAHVKGVIHRDIKPENIMLPYKKGRGRVVLMDFGVAHATYLGTVGTQSTYLGTPFYMSPDQLSRQKVDGRSDIYSLGVVFFEMLTGRRPFDDPDPLKVLIQHRESPPPRPSSFNPKIPPALESVVLKMLAKRPRDRYKSVEDLLVALQEYMVKKGIDID